MHKYRRIHFIGIGGIGMSALARHYLREGVTVTGTDAVESSNTKKLTEEGAAIAYVQDGTEIHEELDMVVYTEAMAHDHPELVRARELGIKSVNYFQALGEVANEYFVIAVAGTHGKTTTTAMLVDILEEASFDPTAVVGSLRVKTGSNYRRGKSKYFVVEACEYKRDFLHIQPDVLIILNLEHEHVDYYKNLEDVQDAFHTFARQVREGGALVTNVSDPNITPILTDLQCPVLDYKGEVSLSLRMRQPGLHNRLNAAAATKAAMFLSIESVHITQALENFAGTVRRFEYKGVCSGAAVYDDYAHHPTELAASIAGARELYPDKKLTVVFQPHTFSRTTELFSDFVDVLRRADRVCLIPVYAARSEEGYTKTSQDIVDALTVAGISAQHFMTHAACALAVSQSVCNDDVVLVMGAGDVTKIAQHLVSK